MMDKRQLHMMTDSAISDMIDQLTRERERRIRQMRDDWRRELQEQLDTMLIRVGELSKMDMVATIEIEGDGNDRIFPLTDFVKTDGATMKVVLRPVIKARD